MSTLSSLIQAKTICAFQAPAETVFWPSALARSSPTPNRHGNICCTIDLWRIFGVQNQQRNRLWWWMKLRLLQVSCVLLCYSSLLITTHHYSSLLPVGICAHYLMHFGFAHHICVDIKVTHCYLMRFLKSPNLSRLCVEYQPAPLLNFTRLRSHMLSPVSGHGANFKVGCVHRPEAKTICQWAHHSLSTGRRAVTGNSLEGKQASETHSSDFFQLVLIQRLSWEVRIPPVLRQLLDQCKVIPPPVKRFSTPHGDEKKNILTHF